eukprot:3812678-Rhodomonas_salina.2
MSRYKKSHVPVLAIGHVTACASHDEVGYVADQDRSRRSRREITSQHALGHVPARARSRPSTH